MTRDEALDRMARSESWFVRDVASYLRREGQYGRVPGQPDVRCWALVDRIVAVGNA